MSKKVYIIILALTILLYTLIVLQPYIMEIGEVFGYRGHSSYMATSEKT